MFHYVYQITNLIDGKIYIGKHSTEDLEDGYMGANPAGGPRQLRLALTCGSRGRARTSGNSLCRGLGLDLLSHFLELLHMYGYENFCS